jgi:integrase/recombinase XerD
LGIDWKDLKPRAQGGQVTVMGKGGKVRTVLVGESLWQQLQSMSQNHETEAVFVNSN